ncbi:ribonuclease H-like domain-containing protein [Tanacetum coccineum]
MTRSSTTELFTPYKELEREFRSSRKHFKSLSLNELRSYDFNLFSNQEYSEEEEAEAMAETMEQYMSKTRTDYGSRVARPQNQVMLRAFPMSLTEAASRWLRNKPTGSITTWEYLKTKFLSKFFPPARTAKKMEEINNFQQEPDENLYQAWERFKELLIKYPQHYLTEMQETTADAKIAIQEMAEYSQKWHNGTSRVRSTKTYDGFAAIQAQLNNLGREIKKVNEKVYAAQVGWGYRATAPGFYQRNNANPSYQERRQSMEDTLSKFMSESAKRDKENSNLIKEIQSSMDATIRNQGASIKTLEIQIRQMSKVLQERGFGSIPSSTKTNPRDQVKSISTTIEADSCPIRRIGSSQYAVSTGQSSTLMTVKYPKGIAKNVLIGIGKFTFPIDFIILDMPEDIKVPLILGRPFLSTAHAKIDVYKRKITLWFGEERIVFTSVKPASSLIKRVSLDPFLEDYIELNDLNEPFELRRNQRDDLMPTIEEGEVIEEFRTRDEDLDTGIDDYPILEDMDAYRDEGMGDVIFSEPFLIEVGIKTKWFERIITLYKSDEEVTYQMVRSHPRFKNHTNKQCNKILPLLKVSEKDEKNRILHAYQNLKGFYKGVLNLGPDYI